MTVMFCDLVASTELSQRIDDEDLRDVMRRFYDTCAETVARYDGHVANYLGDGLLIYFGYPRAHEDDAERAVRAGRDMMGGLEQLNAALLSGSDTAPRGPYPESASETPPLQLSARIGIHTGPVIVGDLGGGARREAMALGETMNLAARLQTVARPGTIVISGATLHLVRGIFVTEDLGPQTLKGFANPVAAYHVIQPSGVRSRLVAPGVRLTPFVGREFQLSLMLDRWAGTCEGRGSTILVTGEPGVGKSRLVHALREQLAEQPHTWLECRCTPYTQHSAFHPVIELLEQGLAFGVGDSSADKIAKLEEGLSLSGFSLPETVPLFAALLSIPLSARYSPPQMGPDVQRTKTLEALARWNLALAEQQPVLLVFEDLHWCDPSTLELLGRLIDRQGGRVMTVATARLDFEAPWKDGPTLARAPLSRLTNRQVREMLSAMVTERTLPDAVVEAIADRADGVPLFVEELAHMVLESGLLAKGDGRYELRSSINDLAIPATLQDSLTARLDRLSAAKEVAQRAAAIGREFEYALLEAVAGLDGPTLRHGLERLVEAELIYRRGTSTGETYTFKHALIQDAAYQSLLRRTRQGLHERIATVLEARFPERAAAAPEVVAHHYEAAGLPDQAATHYQRAGEQATARSANEEAIVHLRKGISLLLELPESEERDAREFRMQVALGSSLMNVRGFAHPEVRAAYERARVLSGAIGDASQLGYALLGLSIFYSNLGEMKPGEDLAERVLQIGERTREEALLLMGHVQVAIPQLYQGRFSASARHCQQAMEIYDPGRHRSTAYVSGTDQGVAARGLRAWALWHLGYPDQALACIREGVELARRTEHPFSVTWALFFECGVLQWRRDWEETNDKASEVVTLGETHGFPLWLGLGRALRAWARAWSEADPTAVPELTDGMTLAGTTGSRGGIPALIGLLAETHQLVGQLDEAAASIDLATAVSEETDQPYWNAELGRMKGELLLQKAAARQGYSLKEWRKPEVLSSFPADVVGMAEESFRTALEVARAQEGRSFELRAAICLGSLLHARGETGRAASVLEPILGWFTEGLDTFDLREARALMDEIRPPRPESPAPGSTSR